MSHSEDAFPWWKLWKKRRYVVTLLAFFGYFTLYGMRATISIAVVAMAANTSVVQENGIETYVREFDWDSKIQGFILSSFYYGYILSLILGGWLGAKVGGKQVFGFGIAVSAFFNILTPFLVKQSVYLLLAARLLAGLMEGLSHPCINVIWSKWAPPCERSIMTTIVTSGMAIGTVVALPTCAYLNNALGWESIFYFFGAQAMVWVGLWWYIVAESPSEDCYIGTAELNYITKSLKEVNNSKQIKYPWKRILASMPVWTIIVAQFCDSWNVNALVIELPIYMTDILKFNLAEVGFVTSLPFIGGAISLHVSGQFADFLISRNILTTTQVRKLINTFGFAGAIVFLLTAAHMTTAVASISCLLLAQCVTMTSQSGYGVNVLDIAPQYASVIIGISTTISSLTGMVAPAITGHIVTTGAVREWRTVFYISSAMYCFGAIVFAVFASGELQPWAVDRPVDKTSSGSNTNGYVLKFNLAETGFMSALPYIAAAISLHLSGHFTDFLLSRNILTTTQVRKLINTVGFAGTIIVLLARSYMTSVAGSITCLILALSICMISQSGFGVNALDIAPQYASIIKGISTIIAALSGILAPIVTGHIVTTGAVGKWRVVFYISSAFFCFGGIVFAVFSTGELQPWAVNNQIQKKHDDYIPRGYINPVFTTDIVIC